MERTLSAVAFDLDDTLYPERDFVFGGYRAAAKLILDRYGVDILQQLTDRFIRGERGDLFTPCLKQAGCYESETQVLALVRAYREHRPNLAPYEDVLPALERIKGKARLCVITDGWAAVQRRKLDALDFERYFDLLLVTDDLGREFWKPHPMAFQEAATRLGCRAEEMVYIADNPLKDFKGPRALGMDTVRVRRRGTLYGDLEPAPGFEADVEVTTLQSAIDAVLPRLRSVP